MAGVNREERYEDWLLETWGRRDDLIISSKEEDSWKGKESKHKLSEKGRQVIFCTLSTKELAQYFLPPYA